MKIFNVMFPYPLPLPLGTGEESTLSGFFDGMSTSTEEKLEQRECLPDQLRENIEKKKQAVV